jgi:HPt (histidine-containing phosphotransfer) domain-containing protein
MPVPTTRSSKPSAGEAAHAPPASSGAVAIDAQALAADVAAARRPAFERCVLAAIFAGDEQKIGKFARLFVDSARTGLQEIDLALAAHDLARAAAVAHRLKSSARTVGAAAFGALCAELEAQQGSAGLPRAIALGAGLHTIFACVEAEISTQFGAPATAAP